MTSSLWVWNNSLCDRPCPLLVTAEGLTREGTQGYREDSKVEFLWHYSDLSVPFCMRGGKLPHLADCTSGTLYSFWSW